MEKKISNKLLIVVMIITILAADFFVLGSGLKTYAADSKSEIEGYSNIHFSTYFKEGEKETKQINKNIKENDLKLYAKIGVNSDVDCLEDIQIQLKDCDFNIISSNKGARDGNTVNLDYIGAGTSVEIELDIEPILANKISAEMLLKTNIELTAKYKHADAPEGETIQATSESSVKYQPDETIKAELVADIITNKVFSLNGANKRIVQVLVKSRLTNNEYPVKQTTLNVSIPKLSENAPEINVLQTGELATNGTIQISHKTTESEKVEITINNEPDSNNQISWNKNAYDEIIVTCIYPETVNASKVEITADSEIKLHSSEKTYTAIYTKGIENQELNSVIMGKTEITTEEMYKGQLYANIDAQYDTKTSIVITNPNVASEIVVNEGPDTLVTAEGEIATNTKYITTSINLEKMLEVLGLDGNIAIKNGETRTVINKDSKVDEEGNVVINHADSTTKLEITTSNSTKAGVLEINHTKAITGNQYTIEQIKSVQSLKTTGSVAGIVMINKEAQNIVSGSTVTEKSSLELKETTTKAELTTDRTTISATEANEVTLGIKLITDSAKYDLYKNPSIAIQFPEEVANVEIIDEPSKLYADEFEITSKTYNPTNRKLIINMTGEQKEYPESALNQAYIQLKLKITLSKYVMAQPSKITMGYKNENASHYEGGTTTYGLVEQPIEISAPSELIKMFNISSNANTSLTEKIIQQVKTDEVGKEFSFDITLINNKDTKMNNVKILGQLPTTGNTIIGEEENALGTILKTINASKGTIYYTENVEATTDLKDATNGWTTDISKLSNTKLYLIKIDTLARGEKFAATATIQMPSAITANAISYTQYEVIYETDTDAELKEQSRKIAIASSVAASIKAETTAQVGENTLKNGDTVKEGEVIKYTVIAKNSGIETLKNVQLKLDIPEGTVLVKPIEKYTFGEETIENGAYVYVDGAYYEEITESKKLTGLTTITIPELTTTAPYTMEYEVRINKGTAGKDISNKSIVTYGNSKIESKEITNIVEESNIRVTIKRAVDVSTQLVAKGNSRYTIYVENLSDKKIKDLDMQILAEGFKVKTINDNENLSEETTISEIKPKDDDETGMKSFIIYGDIEENIEKMSISVIVKDAEGKEYRSNKVVEKLPYVSGTISMTSPQNNQHIKEGDTVEYNIIVKNTGNVESVIKITDIMPKYLQVKEIYENKELKLQETVSGNVDYTVVLQPQKEVQVDIKAQVGHIPEAEHGKSIANIATIKVANVTEIKSQEITHILKASAEEDTANVISGIVWLDSNKNNQKESKEEILSNVIIRLYDAKANHYVTDEYGNPIETVTGKNGEYTFTKIPVGSYKIMVEYNSERYDFAIDLNGNVFNKDLGLNEKAKYIEPEQQPGTTEKPENPEKPTQSGNSGNAEKPEQSETTNNTKTVSGFAWLDTDRDGQKDDNEKKLSGIKVKIYNVTTQKYLTETKTDKNGKYEFNNIEKGSYIVIFEYNTEEYEPTTYMAEGVDTKVNSKAVLNNINVNGQEVIVAVTDTINVQDNVTNINIGLRENLIFDLELNKYISKIAVQTSDKTKTYDYDKKSLAKVEIKRKQIQGATVVIEYTITAKNSGEISGYIKNIVDYLPSGLMFSSELNKDWYLSGNNLYTKGLENTELKPGEEKEIKLVLTKTMTNNNVGLINNRAEIYQDYNKYGESDIDSIPNNQAQNEDDFGSADAIIQIATGGERNLANVTLLMINALLIGFAINLMMRNRIIKRPSSKKWRR